MTARRLITRAVLAAAAGQAALVAYNRHEQLVDRLDQVLVTVNAALRPDPPPPASGPPAPRVETSAPIEATAAPVPAVLLVIDSSRTPPRVAELQPTGARIAHGNPARQWAVVRKLLEQVRTVDVDQLEHAVLAQHRGVHAVKDLPPAAYAALLRRAADLLTKSPNQGGAPA